MVTSPFLLILLSFFSSPTQLPSLTRCPPFACLCCVVLPCSCAEEGRPGLGHAGRHGRGARGCGAPPTRTRAAPTPASASARTTRRSTRARAVPTLTHTRCKKIDSSRAVHLLRLPHHRQLEHHSTTHHTLTPLPQDHVCVRTLLTSSLSDVCTQVPDDGHTHALRVHPPTQPAVRARTGCSPASAWASAWPCSSSTSPGSTSGSAGAHQVCVPGAGIRRAAAAGG